MFIAQRFKLNATYNYEMGYSNTATVIMRDGWCWETQDGERSH